MGTERPNTSPVVSRDEIRRHAKDRTSSLQSWASNVLGLALGGASVAFIAWKWPNLTNLQTALIGVPLGLAVFGAVTALEYGYRRSRAAADVLKERAINANEARADAEQIARRLERENADLSALVREQSIQLAAFEEAERPHVAHAVCREHRPQYDAWIVRVRNVGATATFSAHAHVLPESRGWRIGTVTRLWWGDMAGGAQQAKIPSGGEAFFMVARVNMDYPVFRLWLSGSDNRFGYEDADNANYIVDQTEKPIALIRIIVTAEPEISGGPLAILLRLDPHECAEVSEQERSSTP